MYSSSNFIAPYLTTSKTVRILYPNGKVSFTIIICNYQKSSVSGSTLNIVLEDSTKEYKLQFPSPGEAMVALVTLKQAIDTLKPNCASGSGGGSSRRFGIEDAVGVQNRAIDMEGYGFAMTDANTISLQTTNSGLSSTNISTLTIDEGEISLNVTNGVSSTKLLLEPNAVTLNMGSYVQQFSNANGFIVMSVNGVVANSSGNVTIPTGTSLNGTGFVVMDGTNVSYDNTVYYPASNPAGYLTSTDVDLQSVTDNGYVTTNPLVSASGMSVKTASNQVLVAMLPDGTSTNGNLVLYTTASGDNTKFTRSTIVRTATSSTYTYTYPKASGAFAMSVNGTPADDFGDIVVDIAGSQNLQSVLDHGSDATNSVITLSDGSSITVDGEVWAQTDLKTPKLIMEIQGADPGDVAWLQNDGGTWIFSAGNTGFTIPPVFQIDYQGKGIRGTYHNPIGPVNSTWAIRTDNITAAGNTIFQLPTTAGVLPISVNGQTANTAGQITIPVGTGTVTSVSGTTNRITVTSGTTTPVIDIAATYVGQTSITTLGTIGTGTWQGTAIADAYISSASTWNAKQNQLNGTGFVKASGTTISYDNSTYLTANQLITLSGEASGSGTTAITVTLSNAAVIGKVLTGYTSGAGTISATDTILQAIQKLNGNITSVSSGAVTSVSGTTNRITSTGGQTPVIDISASYVGQTSITTLGTIGTGTWQGTAIADAYISSASTWNGKQNQLNGTGFVKASGTTISYDNSTYYLASNPNGYITAGSLTPKATTDEIDELVSLNYVSPEDLGASFYALSSVLFNYLNVN